MGRLRMRCTSGAVSVCPTSWPSDARTLVDGESKRTDGYGAALVPTDGWTTTGNPQHDEEPDPECSRACRKCGGQLQKARLRSWGKLREVARAPNAASGSRR